MGPAETLRRSATALVILLLATATGARAGEVELRISGERLLPESLLKAIDVRWAGAESVFLAVLPTGGVEYSLDPVNRDYRLATPAGFGEGGIGLTGRVAASEDYLAVASGMFLLGWKTRGGEVRLDGRKSFEGIEDIDVFENRLATLGIRRGEDGRMAPDGAIAWVGSLDAGLADLKPVLFSTAGPGARPMDHCATFEIGAVRFQRDGTLVVVPGAEPGVFLYDPAGKLLHTWETEPLGLDVRCGFDDDQLQLLAANFLARWSWLNQFRTVEDVLPLAQGPGLVIRQVTDSGTRWDLTILRRNEPALTMPLPVTTPSTTAHLRGDVRGEKVLLLLYDSASSLRPGPKQDAAVPTRLIFGDLTSGESKLPVP